MASPGRQKLQSVPQYFAKNVDEKRTQNLSWARGLGYLLHFAKECLISSANAPPVFYAYAGVAFYGVFDLGQFAVASLNIGRPCVNFPHRLVFESLGAFVKEHSLPEKTNSSCTLRKTLVEP